MAEERIDILTKDGVATGQSCSKADIHALGHYHNTVHVWFYTRERQILLAQRAASKSICPLLWDVSVAGHVDAGETIEDAALRETQEEIALEISKDDLLNIGVFECFQTYGNGIIDNEFHHVFLSELKVRIQQLVPDPNEVADLKLVDFAEFETILDHIGVNNHLVPSNKAYYQHVLEAIKKHLDHVES